MEILGQNELHGQERDASDGESSTMAENRLEPVVVDENPMDMYFNSQHNYPVDESVTEEGAEWWYIMYDEDPDHSQDSDYVSDADTLDVECDYNVDYNVMEYIAIEPRLLGERNDWRNGTYKDGAVESEWNDGKNSVKTYIRVNRRSKEKKECRNQKKK